MTETDEPTAPTDTVDVTHAPTLPGLELPEYHGRKPGSMKTSLNGAGARLTRPHEIGERVILVVEARAKKAGHEETDDGLIYAETLKVVDLFEVQGAAGTRLLSTVRQAYRESDDERLGRTPLEAEGITLATAGDGTVLTETELADLRGDPAAAMSDDRATPVVVVYSDGARELWPDEFDAGSPRPQAGERFEIDGDGPVAYAYVKELLHAETGETLSAWTDDQEADRLLEMETAAIAAEAKDAHGDAAYYRHEHSDGSVAEIGVLDIEELVRHDGDRLFAVADDGYEWEVPAAAETPTFKATTDEDLAPLDEGAPLPGEDGYDDGLEPLEAPDAEPDVDELADVLDFPAQPLAEDFLFVDTDLDIVRVRLAALTDLDQAKRVLEAERQGRGRKLKTRKGAVDAITARIKELETT